MKIVDIAIKRPVTIWMFVFAVMLFGLVSLSRLTVNLLPELSYPTLTIRTDYIGAAPAEVEQLVSKPIEETIGTVKNVRQVKSISRPGQSDVLLEFEWGTDMDMASLNVREKLDILQLPLDVKKPVLLRFNPSLDPIIRLALIPKVADADLKAVRNYAFFEVKRQLESVSGVASVQLGGGLEQEIHVELDQHKLAHHQLTTLHIIDRLRNENVNLSGGRIKDQSQDYLVRTLNQFKDVEDIKNIIIKHNDHHIIRLYDVATVTDSYKERDSITQANAKETIEIAIYKEGDANSVAVANRIKHYLGYLNKELPSNLKLEWLYNQADFIESSVSEVKSAAVIGGLLAMAVLFLFLKNRWTTFIISLSIPVSVVATFNFMYGNQISLNIMSLGGIALAIGLLVDSAIVVLENIARHKEQGKDAKLAAAQGTKEVATAVIASTLTTVAVFFPLAFVEGIAGQLFSDQAMAITFALLASMIVAVTLIPMLASREQNNNKVAVDEAVIPQPKNKPTTKLGKTAYYLSWPLKQLMLLVIYWLPLTVISVVRSILTVLTKVFSLLFKPLGKGFDFIYGSLVNVYNKYLVSALNHPVKVISAILLLALSSLPLVNKLGADLLPPMSQGEFYIDVVMPTGTKLEQTQQQITLLASQADKLDTVARTYSVIGTGSLMSASSAQNGDNWGRINVVMVNGTSREDEQQVVEQLRQIAANIPGLDEKVEKPQLLTFKAPIQVVLASYNLTQLKQVSDKLVDAFANTTNLVDINPSLKTGHPEVKLHFNHQKLAQLQLTASQVSDIVATHIGGKVASKLTLGDKKVDILVRSQESARNSVNDLRQLIVNPLSDNPITLDAVANIEISEGPSEINRLQQQRVALIDINVSGTSLKSAVEQVNTILAQQTLPFDMDVEVLGQNQDMKVSFDSLILALTLAVIMVYIVMASQFESLIHPFIILFTVPLAGAGSIFGLYLTGSNLTVVVFIGLIMLAGIVVNNAIVLIDRINQLSRQGVDGFNAVKQAAESRLRPIIMTTLTTTLGLLPLALGLGDGAELRSPMALTVIFGLVFSTLLTLFFIPCAYLLLNKTNIDQESNDKLTGGFVGNSTNKA